METFDAILDKKENSLGWDYFFLVPSDMAERLSSTDHKRVVCKLPNGDSMHAALLSNGSGGYQILMNQARRKKLGLVLGQKFQVELAKDTTEFGMPMSDEFMEVLHQVEEAMELFMQLTPGKRRTLIHYVGQVKNPDIRIRRSMVIAQHLVSQHGTIDFKLLGAEIKEANNRGRLLR